MTADAPLPEALAQVRRVLNGFTLGGPLSKQTAAECRAVIDRAIEALTDQEDQIDYDGPDPSVECAWGPCRNHLRRSASGDGRQWCSREHRQLSEEVSHAYQDDEGVWRCGDCPDGGPPLMDDGNCPECDLEDDMDPDDTGLQCRFCEQVTVTPNAAGWVGGICPTCQRRLGDHMTTDQEDDVSADDTKDRQQPACGRMEPHPPHHGFANPDPTADPWCHGVPTDDKTPGQVLAAKSLPEFLRACAAERVTVQPFMLRRAAEVIEQLDHAALCENYTARSWSPNADAPEDDRCVNCGRPEADHAAPDPDTVAVPVELMERLRQDYVAYREGSVNCLVFPAVVAEVLAHLPEPEDEDAEVVEAMADAMSVATCSTRLANIMHEHHREGYRRNARAALTAYREATNAGTYERIRIRQDGDINNTGTTR